MSKFYDEALLPDEMRRSFDVYDRIREIGIPLGSFDEDVVSLQGAGIAGVIVHESGLVYLSGTSGGIYPMNDDEERIKHGIQGAQDAADTLIRRLHWALSCGGEGDLNDVLYTVKALGMVVSPGGGAVEGFGGKPSRLLLRQWAASQRMGRAGGEEPRPALPRALSRLLPSGRDSRSRADALGPGAGTEN